MRDTIMNLDHIIPAGTPDSDINETAFAPGLIQLALSNPVSTIEQFNEHGTLNKKLDELLAQIEMLGGKCVVRSAGHHPHFIYLWDNKTCLSVSYSDKSNNVSVWSNITDPKLLVSLKDMAKEFISEKSTDLIFCIIKQGDELDIKNMGKGSSPLVEGNYHPNVIADFRYGVEAFKKTPAIGRILILNGEPGTGKTHLIRAMLSELDAVFLIVPSNLLEVLDKPEFMPLLLDVREDYEKPIIMIVEDGDLCLVPRENDNISSIASLLNLSDGILGSMLDVKLIISTNAHIKDMDEAILRPGRLTKQINVSALDNKQANEVYRRLCKDDSASLPTNLDHSVFTLAEVYEYFNTKDIVVAPSVLAKRAIGFGRGA